MNSKETFEQELNKILENAKCTHLTFLTNFSPELPFVSLTVIDKQKKSLDDPFIMPILWKRVRRMNVEHSYRLPLYSTNMCRIVRIRHNIYAKVMMRFFESYLSKTLEKDSIFEYDHKRITIDENGWFLVHVGQEMGYVNWNFIDNKNEYKTANNSLNVFRSDIFKIQNYHYRMNRLISFKKTIKEHLTRWKQELWKPPNGHFAKKYAIENSNECFYKVNIVS